MGANQTAVDITATQRVRLYEWFIVRGNINPLQAWSELGIYRLAAAVHALRKVHDIKTTLKECTNRFGEPCRFAEYEYVEPLAAKQVV